MSRSGWFPVGRPRAGRP